MLLYPRVGFYALMLAAAGIPLYIHLPQFAAVNLGLDLATLGAILLAIRLFDLVQDPAIGWAIDRWPRFQLGFGLLAALGLALFFPLLFNLTPGPFLIAKLVAILMGLFTCYSLGMILLYGRSATLAKRAEQAELLRLAGFREVGQLAGVILAAVAPAVLIALGAAAQGYPAFGLTLGVVALLVGLFTLPMWRRPVVQGAPISFSGLAGSGALRLLMIALLNSLPVALTSTLFLFFVQDRLQLPGASGGLLALFFVSAAISVPLWTGVSARIGTKRTLLISMPLAIFAFAGASLLGPGDLMPFAIICAASGAALGADMLLLPAMFSIALTRAGLNASTAFGFWSFAGKLALALAAAFALPLLEVRGFVPGQTNAASALSALTLAYAVIPCGLKILALVAVMSLPSQKA